MNTLSSPSVLDRVLAPVAGCLTPDVARQIADSNWMFSRRRGSINCDLRQTGTLTDAEREDLDEHRRILLEPVGAYLFGMLGVGQAAEEIRNRCDSPWDDALRRPSHADRRKALRRQTLTNEYTLLQPSHCQS